MSLLSCVVDLRGYKGWSKLERQRRPDLGLVGPQNTENPFVFDPKVGVHTAPGWLEYEGRVEGNTFYGDAALLSEAHPFPDDQRLVLWKSLDGKQVLYGLNLASPGCAESLAHMLRVRCGFADGACFDYFVNPWTWLEARLIGIIGEMNWRAMSAEMRADAWRFHLPWATLAFCADFDAGLRMLANETRRGLNGKPWFVIGYDYNYHAASTALDGIFLEDRYTRNQDIAVTKALIERIQNESRRAPLNVLEIRNPETYAPERIALVKAACEGYGWHLSWGKDATAVPQT